jgi:hypothetical protein
LLGRERRPGLGIRERIKVEKEERERWKWIGARREDVGVGDIPTILESFSLSHFQDFQPISF